MKNPGFDFRFTLRYLLSLVICAASIYVYVIYSWSNTTEQIIDENPITITLKKGTTLHYDKNCIESSKVHELPRSTEATILGMSIAYHNILVTTKDGWRGFVRVKEIPEGTIPKDHPFPGFDDVTGHCYSSLIEGFEGMRLEELEAKLGFATVVEPTKEGFTATFPMEFYNSEDHNVYFRPKIRFVDSLAVDSILGAPGREWSWTQWNPLFRIPIWCGFEETPEQWKGHMSLQDSGNRTLDIWYDSDNGLWQAIVNIALFFLYLSIVFFIFLRIPILPFYPLVTFIKYNYHLDIDTTNGLLALLFLVVYVALTPFFAIVLSTTIWNLIWMIIILGGGVYVCGKMMGDIEQKKCPTCNRYDSYELTAHEFSHSTIEQRARTHTSHETRRGHTTSGQAVDVDVEIKHTSYYNVQVDHYNDTYTCRYCGSKKYDTSTEEHEV